MNKDAKRDGGEFWENAKALGTTFALSAVLTAIFEVFFACNPHAARCEADWRLPLISLAAFVGWLVLIWFMDWLTGGSFLKEYRWITSSAIVLVIFWLGISWAQSKLSEETVPQYDSTEVADSPKVYVRYPKNIPLERSSPLEISIWSDKKEWGKCDPPIAVEISSADGTLVFAAPPESGRPADWKESAAIELKKETPEAALIVQSKETPQEDGLRSALNITVNGGNPVKTEIVFVESLGTAQVRGWKSNFLAGGGVLFSLASAALAWFREERKKEQKEEAARFLQSFPEKAEVNLPLELDAMETFLPVFKQQNDLRTNLRQKLETFCEDNLWKVLSTFNAEEIERIAKRFVVVWGDIFEKTRRDEPVHVLRQIQEATAFEDLEEILLQHPQWAVVLNILAKSRYGKAVTLDLEHIPREEQIRFGADFASATLKLDAWLKERGLEFSPFLDAESPFTLIPERRQMWMELISNFDLWKDEALRQSPSLFFKNQWDRDAAIFEYLKYVRPARNRQPFVVLALSDRALAVDESQDFVLQALADAWLFEIVEDETAFYALSEAQRSLVGKLAVWRHGSSASAVVVAENVFDSKMSALRNKKEQRQAAKEEEKQEKNLHALIKNVSKWLMPFPAGSLSRGEIQTLLRLRPPTASFTLFLNATNRLDVIRNAPGWKVVNFQISDQIPMLAEEQKLARLCRERFRIASQEQVNSLEELFVPHDGQSADEVLAQKAQGSPAEMVRLGQSLLLKHAESYPEKECLEIDELNHLV